MSNQTDLLKKLQISNQSQALETTTLDELLCPLCAYRFSSRQRLIYHLTKKETKQHSIPPVIAYINDAVQYLANKTDDSPQNCQFCTKPMKSKYYLNKHEQKCLNNPDFLRQEIARLEERLNSLAQTQA